MKNIIHVVNSFYPNTNGGTENYIYQVAKVQIKLGNKVTIICPTFKDDKEEEIYDKIRILYYKEKQFPSAKVYSGISPTPGLNNFLSIIKKEAPDIVHFHTNNRIINQYHYKGVQELRINTFFTPHLVGFFCCRGDLLYNGKYSCDGKVKHIKCMSCLIQQKKHFWPFVNHLIATVIYLLLPILKKYFPFINLINNRKKQIKAVQYGITPIALSKWIYNTFQLNLVYNAQLVTQGYNSKNHQIVKKKKESNLINIVYVGRISIIKGIDILLEAIKTHQEQYNLIVVGIPNEKELQYYKKIKKNVFGLKHFEWHENLNNNDLNNIYNRSNILCLPSRVPEMAPLVILEAFAHKTPVVGTNYGGIKDMITNGVNGYVFPINNANALSKILNNIKNNKRILNDLSYNISFPKSFDDVGKELMTIYE